MSLQVQKTDAACGAFVRNLDLTHPLDANMIAELRRVWLEHHVLIFPDQPMSDDDLERFTNYFGNFGNDPYIAPIEGRQHIIAVCRRADEKAPIFAESWHTDWSFQAVPPAGTCLFGITIPPIGGDTFFVNQHQSLAQMPADLRTRIEGLIAVHSAAVPYSPTGVYGEQDQSSDRSMNILYSSDAYATQKHPLIRRHPETKEESLYGCIGYIIGIEGMTEADSQKLLKDIYDWQTHPEFQYQHKWSESMLVMWDNRSVLHKASAGYDGHARLLHRTTIADNFAVS